MEIRTITRRNISELLKILTVAGPHGHREWALDGRESLLAMLDNPRLSIDSGCWRMAYEDDGAPVGYALVEPELNIGRIILGVVSLFDSDAVYKALLRDAIARAKAIAAQDRFELHVAVRESESDMIARSLRMAGFNVVRTVLKMQVDAEDVKLGRGAISPEYAIRDADMTDPDEAKAVTDLHNACFTGSWGFSPNTVEEITGRTSADRQRNGFPPIVVIEDEISGELSAYNWITLNEGEGRVEMVGVAPHLRGKRLGWAIFSAGVNRLIQHDAETLVLDVDSDNPPARRIYETAGYRTYSEVRYYGLDVAKG